MTLTYLLRRYYTALSLLLLLSA